MRKNGIIFIIIIMAVLFVTGTVWGSTVEVASVKRLDVNKQIVGEIAAYTLDIPAAWRKYINVEREVNQNSTTIVEKVSFYYKPVTVSTNAELLMELCIYNKTGWSDNLGYTKLSESAKYVFAYKLREGNPFVFGSDRLIFDNYKKEASKSSFFKDYTSFPSEKEEFVNNTITVNGKRVPSKPFVNSLKVVYVPVREICQEIGYSVMWNPDDGTVTISSGSFYTSLGKDINVKQKYNTIMRDGKSYVSTMFFLQILKCGVEIDQYNNVRITKDAV